MKIAMIGLGTTGKIVAEYLLQKQVLALVLGRKNGSAAGKDLGEILHRPHTGLTIEAADNLEEKIQYYRPNVLIDFSQPNFLRENLPLLARCKVNVVTAVTGYSVWETKRIKATARSGRIGVVTAPNITYGVNVLLVLARMVAQLQKSWDFEIIEENHKNKADSPSGTAMKIATALSTTIGNLKGQPDQVPIHSIRSGDIIGRHKVLVTGKHDQIEISHTAFSREAYAEGAFKAAQFILGKTGYFEMKDVYGLGQNEHKVSKRLGSQESLDGICTCIS